MTTAFHSAPERAQLARLDIGLLNVADRACLRLLHRCEVATGLQLAELVYTSRRTAMRHLRRLWQLRLVERTPLPPMRGGVPVAYRLTHRGMQRLGYSTRRHGGISQLRHALDTVDAVCALARGDAVQAWLTPVMTDDLFDGLLVPDSLLVLHAETGSAVVCLEVDEATEHAPTIRAKLAAYDRILPAREGWHLGFVVPTGDRLSWLRRVAQWDDRRGLIGRAWAVTLATLSAAALDAEITPIGHGGGNRRLGACSPTHAIVAPRRRSARRPGFDCSDQAGPKTLMRRWHGEARLTLACRASTAFSNGGLRAPRPLRHESHHSGGA